MTIKQRLGAFIFKRMPVTRHVFDHVRLELNACWVRLMHRVHPGYIRKRKLLAKKAGILVNIGCGPYGKGAPWINLDLFPIQNVFLRTDCRRKLPLANGSCAGIHVEMFLEHLDPFEELPVFLNEVYRSLQKGGVLRVIVPDAKKFIEAYLSPGWDEMNKISYGGEDWSQHYSSKMDALNHVFLQEYEHYGGWDETRMTQVLGRAGFTTIKRVQFMEGAFPDIIDRPYHQQSGLYFEATK